MKRPASKFKELEESSKSTYDKLRKESVYCPALGKEILFSRKGWKHITGEDKTKKRYSQDLAARYKLIPHIQKLISSSRKFQKTIKSKKEFYVIEGKTKQKRCRIIIIKDNKENYIFYSIMVIKKRKIQ